jgi:hypothetical protein
MLDDRINKEIVFFDESIISEDLENKIIFQYGINGHRATAIIWTILIKKMRIEYLMHLDSDIIFVGSLTNPIIDSCIKGNFWLAGIRRDQLLTFPGLLTFLLTKKSYLSTLHVKTIDTKAVIFKRRILSWIPNFLLVRLIQSSRLYGIRFIFGDAARDFFDPISLFLSIFRKVLFLDKNAEIDNKIFNIGSAVGSGCSLYNRGYRLNHKINAYQKHAIHCYMIFSKLILKNSKFNDLIISEDILNRFLDLDFENWKLK